MTPKEQAESRAICDAAQGDEPGGVARYSLLVHARTALPAALDEIARLEARTAELERVADQACVFPHDLCHCPRCLSEDTR